ncbi:MAG: DNA cytosine methyltransferase [Anaplasmataceae bacterium]|nr:DNA cytosine methyltransferase [Anaplasmataceae bacterium]
MNIGGLFSGVGGVELGFKNAGFNVLWSNEIDSNAVKTLKSNFSHNIYHCDIASLNGSKLNDIDILVAGFPCQAFSIAGHRKGFEDSRGNVFFHIIRLLKELNNKPNVIFLENVKNLLSHDKGKTFKTIKSLLESIGYHIKHSILNSKEHGNTPQNRERIYIVAFRDILQYEKFTFPQEITLNKNIHSILEKDVNNTFYYTEEKYPKYFNMLKNNMKNKNTIYQLRRIYVRENKNNVCPALTANMGTGGHNVPLVLDQEYKIRKLTPRECFLFQGFPKNFKLPTDMANSHLYKQAGNSVSVKVIERIAKKIKEVL